MTACLLCEDKSHFCQPAVAKGNRKKRDVSSLEGPQWTILVQDDVCSTVFPHGVSWGYLSENIDMYHPGFHDRIDNDIPAFSTNNQLSSAHSVVDWIDEGILIHTSSHPGVRLQWRDNANNVPKLIWKKETETRSGGKGEKRKPWKCKSYLELETSIKNWLFKGNRYESTSLIAALHKNHWRESLEVVSLRHKNSPRGRKTELLHFSKRY